MLFDQKSPAVLCNSSNKVKNEKDKLVKRGGKDYNKTEGLQPAENRQPVLTREGRNGGGPLEKEGEIV